MIERTFESILAVLAEEYQLDGHEVFEHEGVYFARIVLVETHGITHVSEVNLTRIADAIVRRAA